MTDARKIDAEVAQAIFGWWKCGPACESDELWHIKGAGFRLEREMPHYSTNIADAMAVLEKMRELGCGVSLSHIGAMWHVHIFGPEWGDTADDSSIPLAICLCAIKTSKRFDGCALHAVGAERKDCGVQQKEHTDHKEKNE